MPTNGYTPDPVLASVQDECETQLLNLPFGVYYFGTRLPSGRCIVLVGEDGQLNGELSPCTRPENNATDWNWGARTPGATHLGFALLTERITDATTATTHQDAFASQIIAHLPPSKWVLSGLEIAKWLNTHDRPSAYPTQLHRT